MKEEIKLIYQRIKNHKNDRFKSFDHCYDFFQTLKNKKLSNQDKEFGSLHLAFYLASWGMYRGSSFILQKDYKIYISIVEEIFKVEYELLWDLTKLDINNLDQYVGLLWKLQNKIKEILKEIKTQWVDFTQENNILNRSSKERVSEILITKILLGTIGCIPAYDRYFKLGINSKDIIQFFNQKSISEIYLFYINNNDEVNDLVINYKQPPMKIIDAYFWIKGKKIYKEIKNQKKKNKKKN